MTKMPNTMFALLCMGAGIALLGWFVVNEIFWEWLVGRSNWHGPGGLMTSTIVPALIAAMAADLRKAKP